MKTIYLDCSMGAAGDMLMSALYEICEQKDLFINTMNSVFHPLGVTLSAIPAAKCGINGTHMTVLIDGVEEGAVSPQTQTPAGEDTPKEPASGETVPDGHHTHGSTFKSMLEQISSLALPQQVCVHAAAIYRLIGEAEAKVHHSTIEQIHFHEVGTLDALADVVGCSLLIYLISPEQILSSPVHVGNGYVKCAHGILPVPAPATAELLKGIPCYSGTITGELCTPTGAAVLKHFVTGFGPMPVLTPEALGYGMGTKDFPIANCVRATLGTAVADSNADNAALGTQTTSAGEEKMLPSDDTILSISANIDDMTGEALGLAAEILMMAGALDVYTIPIQMKKNRPGILLTCLCRPKERDKFTGLFFLHTSTRGVRYQTYTRAVLESTFETKNTAYGDIRIKKSIGYGVEKEKAEFEDLKSVVLGNNCQISIEDVRKKLS